jgi:Flp pilus assembly protein CpaB
VTKRTWLEVLVVVPLLIVAALGTVGVYVLSHRVDLDPYSGPRMAVVVVSEVDIPAGTDLNELIKDDQFKVIQVPEINVVDSALTSIDQLKGTQSRVRILTGEQIPASRIEGA